MAQVVHHRREKAVDLRARAFDDYKNPPIGEVLNIAGHCETGSDRLGCVSKPHPLHTTAIENRPALLGAGL
jgi:hypothetical protein